VACEAPAATIDSGVADWFVAVGVDMAADGAASVAGLLLVVDADWLVPAPVDAVACEASAAADGTDPPGAVAALLLVVDADWPVADGADGAPATGAGGAEAGDCAALPEAAAEPLSAEEDTWPPLDVAGLSDARDVAAPDEAPLRRPLLAVVLPLVGWLAPCGAAGVPARPEAPPAELLPL
jgi:hypothetical protein